MVLALGIPTDIVHTAFPRERHGPRNTNLVNVNLWNDELRVPIACFLGYLVRSTLESSLQMWRTPHFAKDSAYQWTVSLRVAVDFVNEDTALSAVLLL